MEKLAGTESLESLESFGSRGPRRSYGTAVAKAGAMPTRRAFVCAGLAACGALALGGCGTGGSSGQDAAGAEQDDAQGGEAPDPLTERVEQTLASLTLHQKVCQLFCIRPEALTGVGQVVAAGDTTRAALEENPVGGLVYFGQNITGADQFRALIADTAAMPMPVKLFLAIDEEGGPLVARVAKSGFFDVPVFPSMLDVGAAGDPAAAYEVGDAIGTYLADLGLNVDFAPVADVLTDEASSIGSRAFSGDPQVVAAMVEQEVVALQSHGVSATAKHFPGHGGIQADSHTGAAVSECTLDELRACEFVPFHAAIEAGVDLVMVGHISTPNAAADGLPASLSPTAITGWLRGELGFDGIVTSDSLDMGAVTDYFESDQAAVAFLQAGGDLILDPHDFALARQGVLDALADGTLTEERIDDSLRRILRVKLRG